MLDSSARSRVTVNDTLRRVLGEIEKPDGRSTLVDYSDLGAKHRAEARAIMEAAPLKIMIRRTPATGAAAPMAEVPRLAFAEEAAPERAAGGAGGSVAPEMPKMPSKHKAASDEAERILEAFQAASKAKSKAEGKRLLKAAKEMSAASMPELSIEKQFKAEAKKFPKQAKDVMEHLEQYKGFSQDYEDAEGNEVSYPTSVIKKLIKLRFIGKSPEEIAEIIEYPVDEVKNMVYDNYDSRF